MFIELLALIGLGIFIQGIAFFLHPARKIEQKTDLVWDLIGATYVCYLDFRHRKALPPAWQIMRKKMERFLGSGFLIQKYCFKFLYDVLATRWLWVANSSGRFPTAGIVSYYKR